MTANALRRPRAALRAFAITATVLAAAATRFAGAEVTATRTLETFGDWNEGEADGALITSLGEVKPGWATKRTDLELDAVWSAATADGSVLLGSASEGAIFQFRGDKVTKLGAVPGVVAIPSLAIGKGGAIYAGTMPGGQLWKLDAKSGKGQKVVQLDDVETVWALAFDGGKNTLYAGTGPEGKLFAIDVGNNRARLVFDSQDKRILALAVASDGGVWIGTSDQALVFRYDPKRGTTRAMADFAGNEITAMASYRDGVVVAANDFAEPTTTGFKTRAAIDKAQKKSKPGQKSKKPPEGSRPGAEEATPAEAEVVRKGGRKGKGTLYVVRGDSRLEQLHALTQTYFTAVVATPDGRIFAGAGDKGRVYLVDTDDSVSTAFDVEERLISQLLYDAKAGLRFATGDAAAFYRSAGAAKATSYLTQVLDCKAPARFGQVVWHGDGKLTVESRSGNTEKADKGWTQWQPVRGKRRGASNWAGRITSPSGRYLQLRVKFIGDRDAVLRKMTVYYLPQNRPARVTEVTLENARKNGKLSTSRDNDASKPSSPVIKINWEVENDDADTVIYHLAVRREGEALWRPINTGPKPLTKTSFAWNTETFPDGYYRLRVTASDRLSNTADRALEHHTTTPLFEIDNGKPVIDSISVSYPRVTARAADQISAIAEMAYSVDDGDWHLGGTQDGLFDEKVEFLSFRLPDNLARGLHTLALRVADEAGNIASASVTFHVK